MNLETYNTENSVSVRRGTATLRIHKKTGSFTFSKAAAEKLKLNIGDKVELHQDKDSPKDWYVTINSSDSAFELKLKGGQLAFHSVSLVEKFAKSINYEDQSGVMLIGTATEQWIFKSSPTITETKDLHPIITSSIQP